MADSTMWVEGTPGDNRYNAIEYRHLLAALTAGGSGVYPTASGLRVTQHAEGANMSVDVAPGDAVIPGTEDDDQGSYLQHISETVNRTIAAADGSNARRDIVGVRIQDAEYSGTTNEGDVVVITGTASGSPADPTLPDNFLALARIAVAAGATSVTSGNITSLRQGITLRTGWDAAAGILRPWDCAWGILAVDNTSSNNTGITSSPIDIGLSVTWTATANRRYKISAVLPRIQQFTNAAESTIYLTNSGGTPFVTANHWSAANETWAAPLVEYNDALSGSVTRKLQASTSNGTITVYGTSTYQGTLLVEDAGPSGPPA